MLKVFVVGVQCPDPSAVALWASRGANAIVGPDGPGDGSGGNAANYIASIRQFNKSQSQTVFHMMHAPLHP